MAEKKEEDVKLQKQIRRLFEAGQWLFYMVMQCLGAICGAGIVKGPYQAHGGGANVVNHGYTKGDGLRAEIVGTFVLVYTLHCLGTLMFLVLGSLSHNPYHRSLGAAIIYNKDHPWEDHWIFWVGPFIGAALAAVYHQIVITAMPFKSRS